MIPTKLPLSFMKEQSEIEAYLQFERDLDSYGRIRGLAAYNVKRGDALDFHEAGTLGRLAFGQESGVFCNLDQS